MNFLLWACLTAVLVVLLLPARESFYQLFPHLFTLNLINHNHSQIIKHTKQTKLPLCECAFRSHHPYETPPSKTVTCRIFAMSKAHGRLCTLKTRLSGRVWADWFLETRGSAGQRHSQKSWQSQKGKEEKSPRFATIRTNCSFEKICNLVASLDSQLRNLEL